MKYKAIIFDLDGVICSTDQYHYEAWKVIADKLNIYFDKYINHRLRGVSRMESLNIILERYVGSLTDEEKQKYAEQKNKIYRELLEKMNEADVSSEVKNTLTELKQKGIMLAIGSSSKNAKFILQRLGIMDYFDKISDGNNVVHSKPDPEVFLKASEYLQLKPEECLVIEDSLAGIEAARLGNMDSVAIGDVTKSNLATYNISSFSNILNII